MPWVNNQFRYSSGLLKNIAANYCTLYDGFPISWRVDSYNLFDIAEHKADFDMSLRSIGKGRWTGDIGKTKYRDFIRYGRLQRIIIADIFGIDDYELGLLGFYNIPQMRGFAYFLMKTFLNGE
mgnify:CR=1 FL=1